MYRIDADGRHLRRLTPLGEYAYGGTWSPDGTRIAYNTFDLAAVARIVVAGADGTGAHVVASFQGMRYPPATFVTWSSTRELAYVDFEGNLRTPSRLLARGATQPAWSPDGRHIAYVGVQGITIADADGRNMRVVADGAEPAWSPDGTRLAYTAAPGVGIRVVNADGSGDQLVDAKATSPRWTPNGRHVIGVSHVWRGIAHRAIRAINLSTGSVRTVTHDASALYGSDNVQPAVGPNGTIVFVAEPRFSGSELRFVRLDGRKERRLTYHCVRGEENVGIALYGTWLADVIDARNRFRDTVSCGAGHDVVYADRRDRVRPSCEVARRS